MEAESKIAMPTQCRIVAYWPNELDKASMVLEKNQWLSAIVTAVAGGSVNLTVFDHWGNTHARQCVPFLEQRGALNGVATWPPRAPKMADDNVRLSS